MLFVTERDLFKRFHAIFGFIWPHHIRGCAPNTTQRDSPCNSHELQCRMSRVCRAKFNIQRQMTGRVLPKSQARENFTSGSVRGLIVASEPRIRQEMRLPDYTRHYTKAIRSIRPNVCIRVWYKHQSQVNSPISARRFMWLHCSWLHYD